MRERVQRQGRAGVREVRRTGRAAPTILGILMVWMVGAGSGCGACWPGSCSGSDPSPDNPTCDLVGNLGSVDPDLWQRDSATCPRLLLDPAAPNYDYEDVDPDDGVQTGLCESGRLNETEESTSFFFRYLCNGDAPWLIAVTDPGTSILDGNEVDIQRLERVCAGSLTPVENFANGEQLEPILYARDQNAIDATVLGWQEGCASASASADRQAACAQVCAGTLSLRDALEQNGTETLPAVDCYLALFDGFPTHVGEEVASEGGAMAIKSSCTCTPNDAFASCLAGADGGEACIEGSAYDEACGESCWLDFPTASDRCRAL
jgi:hypothetical protein